MSRLMLASILLGATLIKSEERLVKILARNKQ